MVKTTAKMRQEGVGCDFRYRIVHPKRGVRTMRSVGEAVVEDGRLVRFIGNTLDITEQERLTKELRRRGGLSGPSAGTQQNRQLRVESIFGAVLLVG
jgi:hypothetical protein